MIVMFLGLRPALVHVRGLPQASEKHTIPQVRSDYQANNNVITNAEEFDRVIQDH